MAKIQSQKNNDKICEQKLLETKNESHNKNYLKLQLFNINVINYISKQILQIFLIINIIIVK